jgi:hypothetical protein
MEKPDIHNPYHPATLVLDTLIGPNGWKLLSQEFMHANMSWSFVLLKSHESATFETVQDEMHMFLGYPL